MSEKIELTPEEIERLRDANSIIPIIKDVRTRTGCHLIEAKQAIEETGIKLGFCTEGT